MPVDRAELAAVIAASWADYWAASDDLSRTSAGDREDALVKARTLLRIVARWLASPETGDSSDGRAVGAARRIANGFVLRSREWPPERLARLAVPDRAVLTALFDEWGVFDWCAAHGFPVDRDVRGAGETAALAVAREPAPEAIFEEWAPRLAACVVEVVQAYADALALLERPNGRETVIRAQPRLHHLTCDSVAELMAWQGYLQYHDLGSAPYQAAEFGAACSSMLFLLFTPQDGDSTNDEPVPTVDAMKNVMTSTGVSAWVEAHRA